MSNIFITDLDHTFLRNDLSISEFSKNTWNKMAEYYTMGIATARTFQKSEQLLQGLQLNAPMVLLDGSLLVDKNKNIIEAKFINKNMGDDIIAIGESLQLYPFVLALEKESIESEIFVFPINGNSYQQNLLPRYIKDNNLRQTESPKAQEKNFKIVYMGAKEELEELYDALQKVFKEQLKYILAPEAYMDCYFLTLLHKDADKAHGLRTLNDHLGLDFKNYTVFGDNLNDLGMFELAHTSVAVANAHKTLKKKATFVSEFTNNEDAVAHYLKTEHSFL